MRVLIVSNLDSERPFGQFLRPFFLGQGMAAGGTEVAHVGIDCSRVDYGPSWSVGSQSLRRLGRATALARRHFQPQVIYAHQNMPGVAALLSAGGVPVAADFHSLPSLEWGALAAAAHGGQALQLRANAEKARTTERVLAARAALSVAAGSAIAGQLSDRYRPRSEPIVVPNGVDHRLLETPPSAVSPYDDDGRAHAVATLPTSSPTNVRALEFLAEAAGRLRAMDAPVEVNVLGATDGPGADTVRYRGHVTSLEPWLDHADVCLLPYPADAAHGGSKNKLLEALARGRRVVSTPEGLGGLEEAGGWTGVHLTPVDPAGFATAVVASLSPEQPMLDRRRALLRERYRWDRLALEVVAALETVSAA